MLPGMMPGLGFSAPGGIDSWTYETTNNATDVPRVSNVELEGFNGTIWVNIDDLVSPTTTSTVFTRTNGVDFTSTIDFEDFRFTWTLSANAAVFCVEIQILKNAIDLTSGSSPTETPSTSNDPSRLFDDNAGTSWPNVANVSSGQIVEVNIV